MGFGCVYRDKPVSRGEKDYDKRIECKKGEGWNDVPRHTREKLLEEETSINQEDGYLPADGQYDQSNNGHGSKEHHVHICKRPDNAR
jgi:hypothetical protein